MIVVRNFEKFMTSHSNNYKWLHLFCYGVPVLLKRVIRKDPVKIKETLVLGLKSIKAIIYSSVDGFLIKTSEINKMTGVEYL